MGACFNERGRTAPGLGVGASEHVKAHRELENAREFVKTAWSQLGALPPRSNKNAMKRQLMHELLSAPSREDHTKWSSEYWQQVKHVSKAIWEQSQTEPRFRLTPLRSHSVLSGQRLEVSRGMVCHVV